MATVIKNFSYCHFKEIGKLFTSWIYANDPPIPATLFLVPFWSIARIPQSREDIFVLDNISLNDQIVDTFAHGII